MLTGDARGVAPRLFQKLNAEIGRVLALPDLRDKLIAQEMHPFVTTPDQFAALIRADAARYAHVIKAANIRLDGY